MGWFRTDPALIAACSANQLVFLDGLTAIGQTGGTHPQFIMSPARDRALHDFFDLTYTHFTAGTCP